MDYQNILFTVEAGIARLTLNRPDKLNSFTGAMHAELRDALDTIQSDKTIRVLVLTGAGRAFCAGQDLADPEMAIAPGQPMPDIGNVVENNYKPLDLVVASKSAAFLQPSARSAWCLTPAQRGSCPSASAWPAPWAWPCWPKSCPPKRLPSGV